jgi:phosphinothricin acetyltransferase
LELLAVDSETRWRLVRKLRQKPQPEPITETIRDARYEDLPAIKDIYNYFIRNTSITFDDKPLDLRHWTELHELLSKLELPFLVLDRGGEVIGFAYLQPWRQRAGYQKVVETSIYLSAPATSKGFGSKLMTALISKAKVLGIREVIAVIADRGADASIAIHKKFGFTEQGHLAKVAIRFGKPIGSYLFSLTLPKG